MSYADVTLEQFIAMPDYRRNHVRIYSHKDFPPDSELPPAAAPSPKRGSRGFQSVYFIQAGGKGGPIKIGIAVDCTQRLASLQTANAEELRLLCITTGGRRIEEAYHARFKKHLVRGEWFKPHPDILAEIDRLTGATQ